MIQKSGRILWNPKLLIMLIMVGGVDGDFSETRLTSIQSGIMYVNLLNYSTQNHKH